MKLVVLGAISALTLAASPAAADVLYQSVPDLQAHVSTTQAVNDVPGVAVTNFDLFTNAQQWTITGIQWVFASNFGLPGSQTPAPTSVSWGIFSTIPFGGSVMPGGPVYSGAATSGNGLTYELVEFAALPPPFELYHNSIVTINFATPVVLSPGAWFLGVGVDQPGGITVFGLNGDGWTRPNSFTTTKTSAEYGFALLGPAVPEPSGWAMLILGFGLTGFALRRRRLQTA